MFGSLPIVPYMRNCMAPSPTSVVSWELVCEIGQKRTATLTGSNELPKRALMRYFVAATRPRAPVLQGPAFPHRILQDRRARRE